MIFIVYKIKINKVLNQACDCKWAMDHIHITVCVCNNRKVEIVGSVRLYMHLQWDSCIHENHTSITSKSVRKKFSKYGYCLKQFTDIDQPFGVSKIEVGFVVSKKMCGNFNFKIISRFNK